MTAEFDALVLDAGLRQSLVTIRSLGRRGLRVAALGTSTDAPAFSSRWCRRGFVCPADATAGAYLDYLEQLLERTPARVIIPSHDGTIALLRQHRTRLERRARVALAPEPAVAIAINKERTLATAARLSINIPRSVAVKTIGDVPLALGDIGLPAVVKPTESWLAGEDRGEWVASRLVTTPDEARRAVAELTRFGGIILLQQLLLGRREAIGILYANGEVHARFAHWEKRTHPPLGGGGVLRQSIGVPPDIGNAADRLVREIGLEGYSQVEFRRDGSGVPYLMEINSRLTASLQLAVQCGVDFPYLVYQWATGAPIDRVQGYRVGRWLRDLHGDLQTTITALEQRGRPGVTPPARAILEFAFSFLRPMGYDYLDWKDPLPAVRATAGATSDLIKRALRKTASPFRRSVS